MTWLALAALSACGCSRASAPAGCADGGCPPVAMASGLIVPGDGGWVATGYDVVAGEPVSVTARGQIRVRRPKYYEPRNEEQCVVGPEGTYLYEDEAACEPFPLPAGAGGPAPCYCLIGRIGNGPPFYVGASKSWIADRTGPLLLSINDYDPADNTGGFRACVETGVLRPVNIEQVIPADVPGGAPVAGCQAIVFYIDGLRPDVVREMAAMGHLPHIHSLFLAGGCWLGNAFTAFPSDTITSNGTMWTGCFSDRHGIKGQVRFSRRTLHSQSYLEPLGPHRSASTVSPTGWSQVSHETKAETIGLVAGDEAEAEFRGARVTNVPPLYERLRAQGADWATGVLPMMPEMPPVLWSRSLVRHMPYFHAHQAWKYIDDANTHFAQSQLLDRHQPVTIIWLPETDSVSHKKSRGQFGLTRRTIARADGMIGEVVEQIRAEGRLDQTYFLLVSDHGHHGGQYRHLSHFDLANDFFFAPRELTKDGRWVGGGLGLSVRQHRSSNHHPGDPGSAFVFVDGDSDGAARIFLPAGHYRSGEWMGGSRPADLLAYRIADHLPPVNLVETLLTVRANHGTTGCLEAPIDLVLMKLAENAVLVATADRGRAVIERYRDSCGEWLYQYTVIANLVPLKNGCVGWVPAEKPGVDPLGLLELYSPEVLASAYDERTWLRMTTPTRYPDSVVALTRHMLWQKSLRDREDEYAPDIVVSARPGWYFGVRATKGTTHGYPLADAMRATLFVSGPNVRRGARILEPCRLADLTPTLLEMTGTPYNPREMDGHPLRIIFEFGMRSAECGVPEAEGGVSGEWWSGGQRVDSDETVGRASIRLTAAGDESAADEPVPAPAPEPLPDGPTTSEPPHSALRTPHSALETLRIPHSAFRTSAPVLRPVFWHEYDLGAWHPLPYAPRADARYRPWSVNNDNCPLDVNNIARDALTITDINVFRLVDDALYPLTGEREPLLRTVESTDQSMRRSGGCPADLARIFDVPNTATADYNWMTTGNIARIDRGVDYLQAHAQDTGKQLAGWLGMRGNLPGSRLLHGTIDTTQAVGWETYRFTQRVLVRLLDETALNSLEDGVDRAINAPRRVPAEIVVPE